eukprot:scaffold32815_cov80-Skeletonema_marinoi.AAC.1
MEEEKSTYVDKSQGVSEAVSTCTMIWYGSGEEAIEHITSQKDRWYVETSLSLRRITLITLPLPLNTYHRRRCPQGTRWWQS